MTLASRDMGETARKSNDWQKLDPKSLPATLQPLALAMISAAEALSVASKALHDAAAKSKEVHKPAGKKVIFRSKKSGTVRRFETCYVAAESQAKPTLNFADYQEWQKQKAAAEASA